ncbi:MAG TPA: ACT domain-containing protein [Nocardioidaceae bacterium]|nr:ACT domain-containing protein [Nocardioidaceae bacterium]
MATFILTVVGEDRAGLVSALSAPIKERGGSWERSQMSRLAGKFAGIVLVAVADDQYDALVAELTSLKDQGLHVVVERTDEPAPRETVRFQLDLLGADRPGIIADISSALAEAGVSIDELSTDVRDAPMAGGTLFEASAVLEAPTTTSSDALSALLEKLADELMVEIRLSDG